MKFYGKGIVWNKDNDKVLCKFIDGVYETEDSREISILQQNYKYDGELPVIEAPQKTIIKEVKKPILQVVESLKKKGVKK